MKLVLALLFNIAFWSLIVYVVTQTLRMGREDVPRKRYVVYGLLWFGGPLLAAPVGAWIASQVSGQKAALVIGIGLPLIVCWGLAIVLLLRWQREDGKSQRRAHSG